MWTAPVIMWGLVFALGLALAPTADAQDKPNIIIQTDIGTFTNDDRLIPWTSDPDDGQGMIRLLLEANEFNVLGLIATTKNPANPQTIHTIIDAYEEAYPNLIKHADGYPTPDYLRSVTVPAGVAARGPATRPASRTGRN